MSDNPRGLLVANNKDKSLSSASISGAGQWLRSVPGLQVLRDYRGNDLMPDTLSGLVICLVLIPSALAYAELAGSGPVGGIYAALAATVAAFLFSTSRHMNVGPDGGVALLAGVAIAPVVVDDPNKALIAGAWLALFTGIILIVAGKFRLGVVANFLSSPVLLGYLNGAALVIIVSQWGKLFGIDLEEDRFILRLIEWIEKIPETHLATLGVGVVVLILLVLAKRFISKLPPIVPVFFIALISGLLIDFEAIGVGEIGEIRDTKLQAVGWTLPLEDIAKLAVGALGLALLIFPEGVLLARAMADKHDYRVDPDRELVALGSCNVASGAVLGFSVGASQTRTLLNSATGGRTQVANLASALFLLVFLALAADLLIHVPKVAIAAILVFVGVGLVDVGGMRRVWGQDRQSGWITLATAGSVVFIGVLPGILIGTAFSIALLLAQLARPHDALLSRRSGSPGLHDIGDDDQAVSIPGLVAYRFYGPLFFANVGVFIDRLKGFIDDAPHPVRQVLIDASAMPSIDLTAVEKLRPFFQNLRDQGIELAIARVRHPLEQIRVGSELEPLFPEELAFDDVSAAVEAFESRMTTDGSGV